MPHVRYRVNSELTAAKAFEDEVVIINTVSGRYYDLGGSGVLVWSLLTEGASAGDLAAALCQTYDGAEATAREDVEGLIQRLLEEGLVVADDGPTAARSSAAVERSTDPYEPPSLTTYTDMEDLLAADPPLPTAQTAPPPEASPHS
jgi:hypothetical protein